MSKILKKTIMQLKYIFFFSLIICSIAACNLEQDIEVELPAYETQKIVECYLEPGEPFALLLTKSDPYFAPFPTENNQFIENILEEGAEVTISYGTETVVLENEIFFNFLTGKIFNYSSEELVPADFDSEFTLEITTAEGERITSSTRILPPNPIDSLVVEFGGPSDTLARVLTYLTDDMSTHNFYRRMLHEGSLDSLEQDFPVDDSFVENGRLVFGSLYEFEENDTVFSTIIHITEDYFKYLTSIQAAIDANGNPFGQPSSILSNVEGEKDPIGIFTGMNTDRQEVIIER